MRTLFGAVAGALAVGAVLVSYDLGERRAFNRDTMTPTTQMVMGPDGIARPYLVQAGQTAFGQPFAGQPYGWSPYTTMAPTAVAPMPTGRIRRAPIAGTAAVRDRAGGDRAAGRPPRGDAAGRV